MSKRRHVLRPTVEGLESKALLSGAIAGPVAAAAPGSQPIILVIHLDGTIRGHYRVNDSNPDMGSTYVLNGSGHVHDVGHADLTGELHTLGFVAQGHAQGDLFLAGTYGTIALHLTGPEQDHGPKPLPDVFHYAVVGGTGKYTHVQDSGIATFVPIPDHSAANPTAPEHGKFTLVLTSTPTTS